MTEKDRKLAAMELRRSWSSQAMDDFAADSSPNFCAEMSELSMENVFERLWVRPDLDLRARSLVTLGILIALRAHDELMVHFPIAIKNGCTLKELEEVIYHSTAYAGFPAANVARRAALKTLRQQNLID